MNPTIVRAYQYLVALVAIHMVVLGAANALRVVAELALGAPSGSFIGLPFLFAEGRARPLEIDREQMSLAIALLLVGLPAWYLHWRPADRAARRSPADRSSEWRSLYLHVVMGVTALLALGYGARTLSLLARAALYGSGPVPPWALEREWPARAAGAAAMALAAAATWWWHSRRSDDDRRIGVGVKAGELRRFETYAVLFIITIVAAFSAIGLVSGIWMGTVGFGDYSPSRDYNPVKEALGGSAPPLVLASILGGLYLSRAATAARVPGSEGAAERGSITRAFFLYLGLFLAASGALLFLAFVLGALLSRLDAAMSNSPLGPMLSFSLPPAMVLSVVWILAWVTAGREVRSSNNAPGPADVRRVYLYLSLAIAEAVALIAAGFTLHLLLRPLLGGQPTAISEFGLPVPFFLAFAGAWVYHRAVLGRERRLSETALGADVRRVYSYLFYVLGLGAAAIGLAGTIGVIGSHVLRNNTHGPDEIGLYLTLAAVGLMTTVHQWWSSLRAGVDPAERAAPQRRLALTAAVLGGAGAVLAFGSGAVFRIVNAVLAAEVTTGAVHDLWHLIADAGVGLVVALFHWRILRADRALAAPVAAPPPLVLILPSPVRGMRGRLVARFGGEGGRVFETDADGLGEVVRRLEPPPTVRP